MMLKAIATIIILLIVEVILATPAAAQTSARVDAPELVDGAFIVTMGIENAADIDSGQFDLCFDPAAVGVTDVDSRDIGVTAIPLDNGVVNEYKSKALFNLPDIASVSGSCILALSDALLVGIESGVIPSVRIDDGASV